MNRNILLVEPGYKTKFPPLGLMKISAYHKKIGDTVTFTKGIDVTLANEEYWDRIYVSTVFTYNWKVTVKSINYYKDIVGGDINKIFVGGVLATLMPEELWRDTGITPITGLIDKPRMLDKDNDIIVDDMIPDYTLFDKATADYTLVDDSYFGYSTRGCIRKCSFCAVPTLEPGFDDYKGILIPYINKIEKLHGPKRNLVLFDNNILASEKLERIINDIVELGFYAGAKFENKLRKVDFNQGTDGRLFNETNAKLLSKIPLNPLRIAFDFLGMEKAYSKAIRMAAKFNIRKLSNYILYNFKDTPEELWKRLKINIDLNKELDLQIYSFPMKFIPLDGQDRSYISEPNWNWHFIRGIQRITNVMHGAVMPSESFFNRAFGESVEEFMTILHMPESIIMNRGRTEGSEEREWKLKFKKLTINERNELLEMLCTNRKASSLAFVVAQTKNQKLKHILEFYLPDKTTNQKILEFSHV